MLAAGCGVNQLRHKVGGALCTLRRSGGMETYQQLGLSPFAGHSGSCQRIKFIMGLCAASGAGNFDS